MGRWTFQVGLLGRDIFLKIFLFLAGAKNDFLQNTKIFQKSDFFFEKNFGRRIFS